MLPLLFLSVGAPLGEPVADDYDYLHHFRFTTNWSWLDGGGSVLYWRPLARQAYYSAFLGTLLTTPIVVALFHLICLALAGALLYRALRPALGSVNAFAIATFIPFMESSRMLIAWPSNFQDVGCILFVALALHEAVAKRLPTFLLAALASFLCKEVGVVGAALALVCPATRLASRRERLVWVTAFAVVTLAWAALYRWVHIHAPLQMPGASEIEIASRAIPWPRRIATILEWCARATVSLPPASGRWDRVIGFAFAILAGAGLVAAIVRTGAAARLRASIPWIAWGAAWSLPLAMTLVPFYPGWGAYRMAFIGLGAGVAAVAALSAAGPRFVIAWMVLRLVASATGPPPVNEIARFAPEWGSSIDLPRLTRLQWLVADVRATLKERFPTIPRKSAIVRRNFPLLSEYAFGSRPALHVWYGDTTLAWTPFSEWLRDLDQPTSTVVEYQDRREHEIALVEPDAMRALLRSVDHLNTGRFAEGLQELATAESLQSDTAAVVFRGSVFGKRAYALIRLRRFEEAEAQARRAVELYPAEVEGHFVLALVHLENHRLAEARDELLKLLAYDPQDVPALRVLAHVDSLISAQAR